MAKKAEKTKPTGSLRDRLLATSTIDTTEIFADSKFNIEDFSPTDIPALNIILSGEVKGGVSPGLTQFAAPSKHFKSNFGLQCCKAFMDKHKDAIMLFYDCEFGITKNYVESADIDPSRIITTKFKTIEELRGDIANQLNSIDDGDKVIILIDSIGNMASAKECKDAEEGNSAADMTRAKVSKSLFRIATSSIRIKGIPLIAINHTYRTMEMFSTDKVSGGTGNYYSANGIFFIGRRQIKNSAGKELGFTFTLRPDKSRFIREKGISVGINVHWDTGIQKFSGLVDMAMDAGLVIKPKNGYYSPVNPETGEVSEKQYKEIDMNTSEEFWKDILDSKQFQDYLDTNVKIGTSKVVSNKT